MGDQDRDAKRAMLEWVDSNAESIMSALRHMGDTCHDNAIEAERRQYPPAVIGSLRESAAKWRRDVEAFSALYEALPDRETF